MTAHGQGQAGPPQGEPPVDVRERGANGQISDRRLFMQLQVLTGVAEAKPLVAALEASGVPGVLYADVNDARGVGVLAFAEDPAFFAREFRGLLAGEPFAGLTAHPELTMLGRTRIGSCTGRAAPCSMPRGPGPSGIRCAGPAPSRA